VGEGKGAPGGGNELDVDPPITGSDIAVGGTITCVKVVNASC
jgi:hypothetical protein